MIGFMLKEQEAEEFEYMLKRELEELLLDLMDERLDGQIRQAMEARYTVIYKLYKRLAPPKEVLKYLRHPST
ncbi:hypothetical protein HXA34_01340 [Salipaludibacillus agaradhaerens]|uniref:hypothetical protein n=1 Tax=Salipaludibacillus agaradhaerens TaxID=76935 RepID=UPI0009973D97|nr:hypothetical protein [Salipaludibacillus agaradhaerens]MCR6104931.1 hypothetical protein [Salipaludibacillus agaradhaerens]MCR6116978.1 hypothetical protein [Salipaludibacillus agaradhaerens]UJW56174.1 hypothetical protein HXZ66_01440 [Bacillus sp. A116_S68]